MRSDGTPGGQAVTERFGTDWATVLASSFGAVVVRCDGRGSGFQGTNLLHRIQKRPGVFEEQDQKDALRYGGRKATRRKRRGASAPDRSARLLQFSAERAVRGQEQSWSVREGKGRRDVPAAAKCGVRATGLSKALVWSQEYGGYVTSLLVSGEDSPVKCGAVLSPITDFELYGKFSKARSARASGPVLLWPPLQKASSVASSPGLEPPPPTIRAVAPGSSAGWST